MGLSSLPRPQTRHTFDSESSQTPHVKSVDFSGALLGDSGSFKSWSLVGVVWVTGVMTLEKTMRLQLLLHSPLSINHEQVHHGTLHSRPTAATHSPKATEPTKYGLEHLKL